MIIAMLAACLALPAYPVTIGEGNELNRRPLDFYYKNSLNETLYYPDEIGFTGMINAISLHCSFVTDLPGMPVKIWMGSTILPDLSGGWIPSTQLVPVFDGVVDFPSGEHEIFIPLQNHFEYQGQNLVVMFNRPMDTSYYSSSNRFFGQTGTIPRALNIYHDRTLFDPANPPATTASASFAQTTFHMTITEVSPDPTLIYPQSVNFGTVFLNTTQYRQIWVSNTGEGSLALNSISLEGSPCFSLQDLPDLPQSLSLWEWLSFQVNYNPTSYGDHSATISILDDTGRALHSIPISGCAPDLEVAYPNGGETWLSGTTETIRWPSFPTEVDIFLSYDAGTNWTALATTDGLSGFYNMTVPALNSSQFKVKLVSTSLPDDYYDESDGTFTISTNPTLPRVIMTHPSNPNLHFEVGEPLNITWTRSNLTSVSLDLSTDDGLSWQEIVSGLDADSYPWTVPYTPGLNFRIRVRSVTNPAVADFSDNAFSISRIQLLSPLGGELLTSDYSNGYTIPITWIAPGMATVNCEYSPDGGTSWISIGSFVAGSGMSNWYLPGVPSDNYLVRISNAANPSINSVSGTFNLRNPLRITHPQVGGFATNGSLINIRWINQDVAPGTSVWWEYSLDNSSWTRINANAHPVDSQALSWFVTAGFDDSVWLRAVNSANNRIITMTEGPFTITDKSLILWSPNGGEEFGALSTQTIQWEASGLSNLNIELSLDDGESWTPVASDVPSTQYSYQWLVPDTPSVNCRIRLSDTSYGYMNLQSDECFSIIPLEIVDPTVDFSADILTGDIPLAVQLTEDVNPGMGNIASRLWDFGDGNTSDQENPQHTYNVAGTYTVSLTITNDFGGTTTETKTDYIIALPNTPRIELLSANSLNFGVVYLGDTSTTQIIEVKNIGTAPMIISSVSYYLGNSQFTLSGTELPVTVPVNQTTQLSVVFIPVTSGAVSDSIYIHSDASNIPSLAVKLSAVGEYVPPATVEGLVVSVMGNDAHLTWQPVTTTIYGTPIEPDGYIVLYNETPYEDEHFYYFHSFVTGTSFVHPFVAQYRTEMFYRIVAVKNYREEALAYLMGLNGSRDRYTWGEIKENLNTLKHHK